MLMHLDVIWKNVSTYGCTFLANKIIIVITPYLTEDEFLRMCAWQEAMSHRLRRNQSLID
jgi:hypothetical protein